MSRTKIFFIHSSAGCYLFVSHTGFGGVAYAMAIICIKLEAEAKLTPKVPEPLITTPNLFSKLEENSPSRASGDYRDILSLTRVLMYGPQSKADVDIVIERYAISPFFFFFFFFFLFFLFKQR